MKNLTCSMDFHVAHRPEAAALVYEDLRLNWSEFADSVYRTAAGLAGVGISQDKIVALAMKNSPAFLQLTYAISHLGAVALPLNYRLAADELSYIVDHAGVDLLIIDNELSHLSSETDRTKIILNENCLTDAGLLFNDTQEVPARAVRDGSDLYRLMYTSGTTSRPKGVMLTYDNLYWKNLDHVVALQLSAEDRLLVVGPLYHVGGAELPGLCVHMMGGCILLQRDFNATAVIEMIATERATGIWLAPAMTNAILADPSHMEFDTRSLRWCTAGGERTPESRIRAFNTVFPHTRYVDAYGMTETFSGDAMMLPGFEISKIGSVGKPLQFVEIEVRDQEGNPVPPGVDGEICMRGDKVTPGYWKEPDKTRDVFWQDGFLRSGDIGHEDEDGFLFLTDRLKDMIISGGENIAASEVERVIYEMPEVLEAAVIARPSEKWGEVPVAYVVPRKGATLTFETLDSHCREHLAGFKCPKELVLRADLPRNPSGKVLKRVLRDETNA